MIVAIGLSALIVLGVGSVFLTGLKHRRADREDL